MNLLQLFKGFIRNYAGLQLHFEDVTLKKFTERELGYFARAGEFMGYYTFQEEKMPIKNKKRFADLVWATYDSKKEEYTFVLHLEHENTLTTEKTLETKLSDAPNLITINWVKSDDYSNIIDAAKMKIRKIDSIENILLILQKNKNDLTIVHAIEISRIGKKIELQECDALVKKTKNGFFYGLLRSEIEENAWEDLITK